MSEKSKAFDKIKEAFDEKTAENFDDIKSRSGSFWQRVKRVKDVEDIIKEKNTKNSAKSKSKNKS